ncbi:histidinol-phosphate transaminase [Paenibacillus sp. YN15]|uniref:histidinol-phosphate transaminase n=1 Tax=Paenibacillus sp. YN15 TaxID=1742774 RepID=UPI000DCF426E|nr:histidinol-phosphate transaminase [Paenibacillus sp. YN15]RAU95580.1 histidinol-phosphate transaminase [Paenibacillus sp. YN15]
MQPKPNIVHLPVYQPGKPIEEVKRELGLTEVTKLASNENPFGSSTAVKDALIREMEHMSLYPDGGAVDLTEAVAAFWGVGTDQIIFGAGSDEVILMIARAYLVPGDETVMSTHTFGQYKHNAEIENAVIYEVPLKNYTYDLEGMLAKVTPKTKLIWICNPNNPTGTMVTHRELKAFLEAVPATALVVLDEAYAEYVTSPDYHDGLKLLEEHPNVVLLRTFSKIYGLASMRIGYGIGHPDVIRTINLVREPFNTTRFAQVAAQAALADQAFVKECKERNSAGLEYLTGEFARLGLTWLPAYGNFIMVELNRPAGQIFEALLKQGYIIRGGHKLDFPTMIRVTVGSREQNEGFIAALERTLAEIPEMRQTT